MIPLSTIHRLAGPGLVRVWIQAYGLPGGGLDRGEDR